MLCVHEKPLAFIRVITDPFHVEEHVDRPIDGAQLENDAVSFAELVGLVPVHRRAEGTVEVRRKRVEHEAHAQTAVKRVFGCHLLSEKLDRFVNKCVPASDLAVALLPRHELCVVVRSDVLGLSAAVLFVQKLQFGLVAIHLQNQEVRNANLLIDEHLIVVIVSSAIRRLERSSFPGLGVNIRSDLELIEVSQRQSADGVVQTLVLEQRVLRDVELQPSVFFSFFQN